MATPRGRLSYQGDPEAAGINLARRTAAYAGEVQRENDRAAKNNAMNALGKNVPASALPAGGIHKNMSQADQDAAVRAVQAYNGTTPPAAHMPGPTHMPANVPQMRATPGGAPAVAVAPTFDKNGNLKDAPSNPGATSTAQTGLNGAFRGSTPDEIKDFYANKPGSATSPAAVATAANAGTGNTVDTPYGKVSSTDVNNGAGATWQQQIVSKHPAIGVKGSPENIAFVKAYGDAKARGETPDHFALAENIAGPSGDQPLAPARPEIAASASGVIPPKSTALQVGKVIHDAPGKAASTVANATGSAINSTVGAAKDLYAGLTGQQPTQPQPGDKTPAQVAGDAALTALNATGKALVAPFSYASNLIHDSGVTAPGTTPAAPSPSPNTPSTAGAYTGTPATPPAATPPASPAAPNPSPMQKGIDFIYPYAGNRDTPSPMQKGLNFIRPYAGQQDTRNNAQPDGYAGAGKVDQNGNAPQTASSDPHADIHAATVNAITTAGQNAHNAVNSSSPAAQPYTGNASPSSTPAPAPQKSQTADF